MRLPLAAILATVVLMTHTVTGSEVIFSRGDHKLKLLDKDGKEVGSFEAYNNVVKGKKHWPNGSFVFSHHAKHKDDAENSAFGSHGNFVFKVKGRTGMGIHSGRARAKNNPGPKHPTEGCIRTTDAGTKAILDLHKTDPLRKIIVKD